MEEAEMVKRALDELGLTHERKSIDEDCEHFTIVIDEGEGLLVEGLLYRTEDDVYFRLLLYVDDLAEENPLEQLSLLMALNGELPVGAFCMDPEERVVYVTANLEIGEMTAPRLGLLTDLLFMAQEIYNEDYYPDGPKGSSGH